MLSLLLGFLTVLLVLNCIVLVLLVLIQLPKKEAGIGMAFGAGATEALFGAGSGTVLTKVTKYSAGLFLGLSLVLSVAGSHARRSSQTSLSSELSKRAAAAPVSTAPHSTNVPAAGDPALAPTISTPATSAAPALLLTSTNTAPAAEAK